MPACTHPRGTTLGTSKRLSAFRAVAVGGSAGGTRSLLVILRHLSTDFPFPVLVVQHLHKTDGGGFSEFLATRMTIPITEAQDTETVEPAHIYVAPADYHMLVEREGTLSLSVDPKVRWARPSIDVLFESAAHTWANTLIGIILSGANADGAQGMSVIKEYGGLCIAQDPVTAESPIMPRSAIELGVIDEVLSPAGIGQLLVKLGMLSAIRRSPEITPG